MTKDNSQNKDQLIRDAQYRKGLSIAWFNANNNAVGMVSSLLPRLDSEDIGFDELQKMISIYRNKFLEDHAEYYAEVVANVGANYNAAEVVKKIEATESMEHLQKTWISLSEDERRDAVIIAAKNQMKEKLLP